MAHGHTPLIMNEYDKKVDKMYDSEIILSIEPYTEADFIDDVNYTRSLLKSAAKNVVFENARQALMELVAAIDCYQEEDLQLISGLLQRAKEYIIAHWNDCTGQVFSVNARKAKISINRIMIRWEHNYGK